MNNRLKSEQNFLKTGRINIATVRNLENENIIAHATKQACPFKALPSRKAITAFAKHRSSFISHPVEVTGLR